jgi:gamma-glutamylaminecyclotransferase
VGKTILLFVYGTLKRGCHNNRLLTGQRYVGEAVTVPHYRLYDLGSYPAMVEDRTGGLAVRGELWEVSEGCLAALDEYEDVPILYVRRRIAVDGVNSPVETYLYRQAIPPGVRSGNSWPLPESG